jgi:hypothetical protein
VWNRADDALANGTPGNEHELIRRLRSSMSHLKASQSLLWSCIYASKLPWSRYTPCLSFYETQYLISAGGHAAHYAYTATVPFPIDLLPFVGGRHPGSSVDIGQTVPTTLMPTGDPDRSHTRNKMISFHEKGGENMCVGPNFACGLNPNVPADYPGRAPDSAVAAAGLDPARWKVFDRKGSAGSYGYYVAVYQQDDFGFFEVYDTFTNSQSLVDVNAFMQKVHDNNPNATFSQSGVNTYKTVDGAVLGFTVDARIVTINGVPPIRDRTNGDVINYDGQGIVTITNPGLPGESLVLTATIPPDHPTISVPGPIHFPDTCVGKTSYATLDICNVNSGAEDLFVYNILPKNAQFAATEPYSGYPVTVSHDFCFPFQVQYTPTVKGSLASSLTVSNSDPQQDYLRVDVTGKGIQQSIATVIADNGSFGNVCLGSFKDLGLTITNSGGCDLTVTGVSSSSSEFIVAGTQSFPLTIHAGDSLAVPIRLQPTSLGAKAANITGNSNDPAAPAKVVAVSGSTAPGKIAISGAGNFGNVCAGSNAQQTITIGNTGPCNLGVTSVTIDDGSGGACPDFTIQNNPFPNTLSHDSSLPVTIAFTPTSGGTKTCRLVIASDDPLSPVSTAPLSATTPAVNLDVPPVANFPATVLQSVGACSSKNPFPVANNGICPVIIKSVAIGGTNSGDYSTSGLPSLATPLQSGHVLGEGSLNVVFKPTVVPLSRGETGAITVTYEDDPITHHQTSASQNLCGEDVTRGMRVLVTNAVNGQPLAIVDKIQISRLGGNRKSISVDNAVNVPLQTPVTQPTPCASFNYHREWGGASNPIQLTAGDYQITVTATSPSTGKKTSKTVSLTLDTCSFNQNIVVLF